MLTDKAQIKIAILGAYSAFSAEIPHSSAQESIVSAGEINVLDFSECENELIQEEMLAIVREDGSTLCGITPLGEAMFRAGKDIVDSDILDNCIKGAARHFDYICTGKKYVSEILEADGGYYVTCSLCSKDRVFMESKLFFETRSRAYEAYENCLKKPEVIFKGLETLMTGKINSLL